MTEYLLKVGAVFAPIIFTVGWFLYPVYRRWRLRRFWRKKAQTVGWLLPPEDRQ